MTRDQEAEIRLIQCLVSLEGNSDFEYFLGFMKSQLDIIQGSLVNCEDELQLRWLQGRAQVYQDLINASASARDDMNRIKVAKEAEVARQQTNNHRTPSSLPVRH